MLPYDLWAIYRFPLLRAGGVDVSLVSSIPYTHVPPVVTVPGDLLSVRFIWPGGVEVR